MSEGKEQVPQSVGSATERAEPGAFTPRSTLSLMHDFVPVRAHDPLSRTVRMLREVHGRALPSPKKALRLTYFDLVNVLEVFRILIGQSPPRPGRFDTANLGEQLVLMRRLGFDYPLLQAYVHLVDGGLVVASQASTGMDAVGQLYVSPQSLAGTSFMTSVYGRMDSRLRQRLEQEYRFAGQPQFGRFSDRVQF